MSGNMPIVIFAAAEKRCVVAPARVEAAPAVDLPLTQRVTGRHPGDGRPGEEVGLHGALACHATWGKGTH